MARTRPMELAAVVVLLAVPTALTAQARPAGRSVLDGVYTKEQALRGKGAFEKTCSECHTTGDFRGELFLFTWSGQGIHILYDFVRASMPQESPGSLSPDTYSAILAFILQLNSFPPGEDELPADGAALRRILLEAGPGEGP